MSDTFWLVGTTFQDDIFLNNAANPTGVTGAASTFSMTMVANGADGSITGLVITQIDAVNAPGWYHIQGNAVTSFVATPGEYSLEIAWTADPNTPRTTFVKTINVTSTGTGGGSTGLVSFTAVAGNGRIVTGGTTPLQGATVVVTTPAGVQYISATTDINGLWGTVYFPASMTGTWGVTAYLAGYQSVAFSITTTVSTSTGPGIDENLTATTVTGTLTLANLMTYGRLQIHNNIGSTSDTQLKSAINDAMSRVSKEYLWSWLKVDGSLIINPYYATGTITIAADLQTTTLSGGTWPTWAIDSRSKLMIGGKWYRIQSQTSNTVIVLQDLYGDAAAMPLGYIVFQDEYTLPSDCQQFGRFWPGYQWGEPPSMCSFETLRDFQNVINTAQNYPRYAAVHGNRIVIWPYPQAVHDFRYFYYQQPATMVNATDVANWDPLLSECLYRCIDHELAIRYTTVKAGSVQETLATYQNALAKCITRDKESPHRDSMARGGRKPSIGDRTIPSM